MSKSEKFRKLLEKEESLRNQLSDCEAAQYRMLKRAFKGLGLKVGSFGDLTIDQTHIALTGTSGCSVGYCRYTGVQVESCEISFEDLFDAEAE